MKCKWFIFPQFEFSGFKDPINVTGGEIAWKSFHDVFERDASLHANLREAPKLTAKVLHPGNCKQNVPNALAIFDETTIAAVKSYFPEKASAAAFLTLFSKWWVLSNSKARYSTANYLGNAAVIGDNKQSFLRTMGDWIQNWQENKIPNCEKFTQTSQTASAFVRTLKCHASLIEDLLAEGYDFIMTSRFQSDPLERRFGQYRQISGGRFLVGLREATSSEKIIKLKTLLKNHIDISNIMDSYVEHDENIETLLYHVDLSCCSDEMVTLSDDSREVRI